MAKVIIASKNLGKIAEIKEILAIPEFEFVTFQELPDWPDVEETGDTFQENALIKARALVERFGVAAIADDSGLEVDALKGAPGVRSSRFAKDGATDEENNAKLLRELREIPPPRRARFRCSAVFVGHDGDVIAADGVLEGEIGFEQRGAGGFGYDPLFIPEGFRETLAELGSRVKNKISHRGKAFAALKTKLVRYLAK